MKLDCLLVLVASRLVTSPVTQRNRHHGSLWNIYRHLPKYHPKVAIENQFLDGMGQWNLDKSCHRKHLIICRQGGGCFRPILWFFAPFLRWRLRPKDQASRGISSETLWPLKLEWVPNSITIHGWTSQMNRYVGMLVNPVFGFQLLALTHSQKNTPEESRRGFRMTSYQLRLLRNCVWQSYGSGSKPANTDHPKNGTGHPQQDASTSCELQLYIYITG